MQIGSGQGDDTDVTTIVCCEPVTGHGFVVTAAK